MNTEQMIKIAKDAPPGAEYYHKEGRMYYTGEVEQLPCKGYSKALAPLPDVFCELTVIDSSVLYDVCKGPKCYARKGTDEHSPECVLAHDIAAGKCEAPLMQQVGRATRNTKLHAAVELLKEAGYTWDNESWIAPVAQAPATPVYTWDMYRKGVTPPIGSIAVVSLGTGVVKGVGSVHGKPCIFVQLVDATETTTNFRPVDNRTHEEKTVDAITAYLESPYDSKSPNATEILNIVKRHLEFKE